MACFLSTAERLYQAPRRAVASAAYAVNWLLGARKSLRDSTPETGREHFRRKRNAPGQFFVWS